MNKKQVVTIELFSIKASQYVFENIKSDINDLYKVLIASNQDIEELLILSTNSRLVFYAYTDDYLPFIDVFQRIDIPPKSLEILVNTVDTKKHLTSIVSVSGIKNKIDLIRNIRNSYELARKYHVVGNEINQMLYELIQNQQMFPKESNLGKIMTDYASVLFDESSDRPKKKIESKLVNEFTI